MYSDIFNKSFDRVIGNEGGYKCEATDRGDWTSGKCGEGKLKGTNWGISAMSYPDVDIKNLTKEDAKKIYYSDFWYKYHLDDLDPVVAYQVFDAIINHGPALGVKILQRCLDTEVDGKLGPDTIKKANRIDPAIELAIAIISERLRTYTNIKTFDTYGKGWVRRMANNLAYAISDNE